MMKKVFSFSIIAVFTLYAQTFNVSNTSEFRKALQDSATNGENNNIILAPGIYKITDDENSTFKYNSSDDNNLTIKGLDSNNTILSGDNKSRILYFSSINHKASLIVKNISFIDGNNSVSNYYADDDDFNGGGIYADNDLYVYNCSFISNRAIWKGGGFYAKNNALVVNSYFKNNRILGNSDYGSSGGGFYVEHNATVINSKFYDNFSKIGTGGGFSASYADVNDSLFVNNISNNYGGGFDSDNAVVNNSIFNNNIADAGGGAVDATYSAFIKDSNFTYNKASGGGGIDVAEENATIIGCNFVGNENNWTGGSAVNGNNNLIIKDCLFKDNKVLIKGTDRYMSGAVSNVHNIEVYNSKFIENNSTGLYVENGRALVRNSSFIKNKQAIDALYLKASNLLIKSSNIGISLNGASNNSYNNEIYNTIFLDINNTAVEGSDSTTISYFKNNYVDPLKLNVDIDEKKNNIFENINLGFKDPEHDNYELTASSDLINKGTIDVNGITLPPVDLAGNPRIVGKTIDIGPYEYQGNNIETDVNNEIHIKVGAGWNMINIPSNISNMASINSNSIWKYKNKKWEAYSNNSDILKKIEDYNISVIHSLNAGDGVWVYENAPITLNFTNPLKVSTNLSDLSSGWNLVGISENKDLTSIPSNIETVWYWDNVNNKWEVYSSDKRLSVTLETYYDKGIFENLDKLEANKAYWFDVK